MKNYGSMSCVTSFKDDLLFQDPMITVTAKSFIGGFDPLNENPPTHEKNMDPDSVQKDSASTTPTTTSPSNIFLITSSSHFTIAFF